MSDSLDRFQLVYYGHPSLRKRAEPVEEVTEEIQALVDHLVRLMDQHNGAGLAGPQINIPLRIFVTRVGPFLPDGSMQEAGVRVYINPSISSPSVEKEVMPEGCLSIPGFYGDVERPFRIEVEALDREGNPFREVLESIEARAVMHENDHLNGVLHIDRMSNKEKKRVEPVLRRIQKDYAKHNAKIR